MADYGGGAVATGGPKGVPIGIVSEDEDEDYGLDVPLAVTPQIRVVVVDPNMGDDGVRLEAPAAEERELADEKEALLKADEKDEKA